MLNVWLHFSHILSSSSKCLDSFFDMKIAIRIITKNSASVMSLKESNVGAFSTTSRRRFQSRIALVGRDIYGWPGGLGSQILLCLRVLMADCTSFNTQFTNRSNLYAFFVEGLPIAKNYLVFYYYLLQEKQLTRSLKTLLNMKK